jgi:hypothetical protein
MKRQPDKSTRSTSSQKSFAAKERLRERYRPDRVQILFIGEAPPASGRFFYQADSGLYRAIRNAFCAAFPDLRDEDFLEVFRSLGCYLVDLCGNPVDRMHPRVRRRACIAGEASLARAIAQLQPEIIVTVVRSIAANVRRAAESANWSRLHIELPYPGRWHHHRREFRRRLIPILRTNLTRDGDDQSTTGKG